MATKTEKTFEQNRDEKLAEWQKLKKEKADITDREMELRKYLVELLSDQMKYTGTEYYDLGNGYRAKMVKSLTYHLDDAQVDAVLTKIEAMPDGKVWADKTVKYKPTLVKAFYDEMPTEMRKILDDIVTTKSGAPSLEIVEPKK